MVRVIGSAWLFRLIFLSGFALMGFEMLGSRYLNPYFGSGITTWACLIAVVLFAMMVGYTVGGIVADRSREIWIVSSVLSVVGVYLILVAFLATPVMEGIMLSAGYVVHPLVIDSNTAAKITESGFVTAGILGLDGEGNRVLAEAGIEVSAGENRITLSGEIPGITADSPLKFKAYDFFEGAVEMSSYGPSITGIGSDSCQSDSAAIRPGQSVVDAVSETLPAYMDITEVSTALTDDGRLVVVFHLRDVPETLEFNRKGVPKDALEYSWRVSVDVVDDRETGLQQADYSLSASYFVFYPSRDEGVHQPIEEAVQTDTWTMDPDGVGAAYLSSASIEVSSEEKTITLVGDISGITSESRLEFEAYDFLHDSEQVACQVLSIAGGAE